LGIFSAAFGIKGFLVSSHFIDGGVTGVSMLLSTVLRFPLSLLIPSLTCRLLLSPFGKWD